LLISPGAPIDNGDSEPINQERRFRPVRRSLDESAVGTHRLDRPSKQTDGTQVERDLGWRTAEWMVPASRIGERNDDPVSDRRVSDRSLNKPTAASSLRDDRRRETSIGSICILEMIARQIVLRTSTPAHSNLIRYILGRLFGRRGQHPLPVTYEETGSAP
jgi:hypothetical protein